MLSLYSMGHCHFTMRHNMNNHSFEGHFGECGTSTRINKVPIRYVGLRRTVAGLYRHEMNINQGQRM